MSVAISLRGFSNLSSPDGLVGRGAANDKKPNVDMDKA